MNPYNQWQQQGSGTPSIFGALPSPTSSSASTPHDAATFTLTNFKTTVLNSTVYDPSRREAYRIVTEASSPACTVVQNSQGRNIAMIKWQPHAVVEVRGIAAEQRVRDWLKLASDQNRRIMDIRGVQYAWAPMDGFICMYKVSSSAPRVLARVARMPNSVVLDVTQDAIQQGLLESALIATVLMTSGHSID